MEITLTELKNNLSKYILLSREKDILITKNGKVISRLTEPFSTNRIKAEKRAIARKLVGSISGEYVSPEDLRRERLSSR